MNAWWNSLNQREQRLLMIGGVALAITLIYLLIVEPFGKTMRTLRTDVSEKTELLAWMQDSERKIARLRAHNSSNTTRVAGGGSLLAEVDRTAKSSKLGAALKRVEPEGAEGVRLWLEQAAFDDVVRWLAQINTAHGIEVSRISVDRLEEPGRVDARISLERKN